MTPRLLPILVFSIAVLAATPAVIFANANAKTTPFPCAGGSGVEYCRGYHDGATAADTDNDNGSVSLDHHRCHGGNGQYCAGFARGYNDEAAFLL